MYGRENVYTIKLEDKELSTLEALKTKLGVRDKSYVMRTLIWRAGLEANLLTDGDIKYLAQLDNRSNKPKRKKEVQK